MITIAKGVARKLPRRYLRCASQTSGVIERSKENNTAPLSGVKVKQTSKPRSAKEWRTMIGLEVHIQLATTSKMFSSSSTQYGEVANRTVTFWDFAVPGTLPVLSRSSVELALRLAKVLNCTINNVSYFDRKHYFYPDLPSGYQITQQRVPIAERGYLDYLSFGDRGSMQQAQVKRARVERLQLEHDSGKSIHDKSDLGSQADVAARSSSRGRFLVDLNRCGVGLVELVTAPDFESTNEACAFIDDLRRLVVALNVSSGKMDEGAMRVDANVSVHARDEPVVPYRVEIKNLNSLYAVRHAIAYETKRHIRILEGNPEQRTLELETRAFDASSLRTVAMRDKQDALDYRFMPEPNLPPLSLVSNGPYGTWNLLESVGEPDRSTLPFTLRQRLMKEDGVSALAATVLLDEPGLLDYYRQTLVQLSRLLTTADGAELGEVKDDAAFWITSLFLALLRQHGVASVQQTPLKATRFAEFIAFAGRKFAKVRYFHAKRLLELMFKTDKSVQQCVAELSIPVQINDELVIRKSVRCTIGKHPESVVSFRKRASKGKFQRAIVLDFLKKMTQRENNDALNDALLDRFILEELADRGCQVRFDDD